MLVLDILVLELDMKSELWIYVVLAFWILVRGVIEKFVSFSDTEKSTDFK